MAPRTEYLHSYPVHDTGHTAWPQTLENNFTNHQNTHAQREREKKGGVGGGSVPEFWSPSSKIAQQTKEAIAVNNANTRLSRFSCEVSKTFKMKRLW